MKVNDDNVFNILDINMYCNINLFVSFYFLILVV